jgi:sterol desaturase/sphingolipid hydroxylase (fatty acid hydroxylase superfamily)
MPDLTQALWRLALFGGGMLFFLALELARPYRRPSRPKGRRWARNLGLTAANNVALALTVGALPFAAAAYASRQGAGLLNLVDWPYWLKLLAALVALDLLIWVWHLLNHLVPLLWRFHRVHHTDLNMDVSTATRFHAGELLASRVLLAAEVYLLGADVVMVAVFDAAVVLFAQFHHSSLAAPAWLERAWWVLFVPPSMHRIHHSVKIAERNSNYGTIFSLWDRWLGTLVAGVDQAGIRIGVGGHYDPERVKLRHLLYMPFMPYVR